MRAIVFLICLAVGTPALAQTQQSDRDYQNGRLKFVLGLGFVASGALIAGTARTTAQVGSFRMSEMNTGRLVFGLAMAGGGGYLTWTGRKQMRSARPTLEFGVGFDRVQVRRTW